MEENLEINPDFHNDLATIKEILRGAIDRRLGLRSDFVDALDEIQNLEIVKRLT
jgi:hypothetical protein